MRIKRDTARVLPVDREGRVLLQLGRDLTPWLVLTRLRFSRPVPPAPALDSPGSRPPGDQPRRPDGRHWLTIGGGRNRRETLAQAGARELHEEAGLRVDPAALIGPLGTTVAKYAVFGVIPVIQFQTYFAVAAGHLAAGHLAASGIALGDPVTGGPAVTAGHQGRLERLGIERHEWLTADELERRPERIVDPAMPQFIRAAVAAVRGGAGQR